MTETRGISIDRLSLRVTGLDEHAARALARAVAEGLAAGVVPAAGDAALDHLGVTVQSGPGDPDALAGRIVDVIGRRLARDRVFGAPGTEGTA